MRRHSIEMSDKKKMFNHHIHFQRKRKAIQWFPWSSFEQDDDEKHLLSRDPFKVMYAWYMLLHDSYEWCMFGRERCMQWNMNVA